MTSKEKSPFEDAATRLAMREVNIGDKDGPPLFDDDDDDDDFTDADGKHALDFSSDEEDGEPGSRVRDWLRRICVDGSELDDVDQAMSDKPVGFDGSGSGANSEPKAAIQISNSVVKAKLNQSIDWQFVVPRGAAYGLQFEPKNFGAIDFAMTNPRVTARTYFSGFVSLSGAKEITDTLVALEKTIDVFRSMRDHSNNAPYADLRCETVRVVNLVGDTNLPFRVSLDSLAAYPFVKYKPEEWPTANIRMRDLAPEKYGERKALALVSANGHVVMSGALSRADLVDIYRCVLPVLKACAETDKHVSAAHATGDHRLRATEKQRRIENTPSSSLSIIQVDPSAQKVKIGSAHKAIRASDGREVALVTGGVVAAKSGTSVLSTRRSAKRSMPTGLESARNTIALQSVARHAENAKAALRAELEAEVRGPSGARVQAQKVRKLSDSDAKHLARLHK